jgi:hypothetical protein
MTKRQKALPWLVTSVAFVTVAASERPHFDSKGLDGAITIDGTFEDWWGHLDPFGSDPIAVQFLNDGEFLYVRLTASDAAARMQIMRLGMTIWFDPSGGTKKKFGIRYPVVDQGHGPGNDADGPPSAPGGPGGRRRRGGEDPPPGESATPRDRVDIVGPGKDDARSLTREHLSGVEVAIHAEQGTLQYELKVPLARSGDHPYAIESAPGKTIGVGVETGKLEMPSFGRGGGGRGMGGGGGRGRGGGGGGMGGGRGGGGQRGSERPLPSKPMKPWATVTIGPVR